MVMTHPMTMLPIAVADDVLDDVLEDFASAAFSTTSSLRAAAVAARALEVSAASAAADVWLP